MKTHTPNISVVMPTYNVEKYVGEAVNSILGQTFTDFELIIVDDGSADRTTEILRSYTDPRIRLLFNEKNEGNYPARNRGYRLTKGKYIAVMDADDVCYPNRLQVQYDYLEAHPDVQLIGSAWHFVGGLDRNVEVLTDYEEIKLFLLDNSCFLHPSVMLRSEAFRAVGGYDERYLYAGDYDLWCRLALRGKIENIPDRLVAYRWHPEQITQAHRPKQYLLGREVRRSYHQWFISQYKTENICDADEYDVGFAALGKCICLYVYAIHTNSVVIEERADGLLEYILEEVVPKLSVYQPISLCQVGCGLLYLFRNGLVCGDEDRVLEGVDRYLKRMAGVFQENAVLSKILNVYLLKRGNKYEYVGKEKEAFFVASC